MKNCIMCNQLLYVVYVYVYDDIEIRVLKLHMFLS